MQDAVKQMTVPIALLLIVPVAPILAGLFQASPIWIFLAGAAAIGVLADWIRRATEQAARRVGPAIGGLLTISFGSLAELILAFFVLASGKAEVVKAQLTGSIIGTSLFGLGLAIIVGCIGRDRLRFKRERASQLSTMLILVLIALLLPAVFDFTARTVMQRPIIGSTNEEFSIGVSIVLIALYGANLVYTLVTHRDVFASGESGDPVSEWPIGLSLAILVAATALISLEAEMVSGALEATAGALHISTVFLGIIVLALVGTVSDIFAAAFFARQGKMGLAVSICVGSSIQVGLVVAPLLVIGSWLVGRPMTLVFDSPLDLFAIGATAFAVNAISSDGETTWFEGVLLVGVYLLLGLAFFFSAPAG
ncbi:MAG: calcium/proton exchanger [Devosia sp.]